jgi:transposase
VGSSRRKWIVPDGLWQLVEPLLPPARVRPQGGGTVNIDDEAIFAAIVYVFTSGCAWRHLPPCFAASKSTVHRRFLWSKAGPWGRLHRRLREELAEAGLVDLSRVLVDTPLTSARTRGRPHRSESSGPG